MRYGNLQPSSIIYLIEKVQRLDRKIVLLEKSNGKRLAPKAEMLWRRNSPRHMEIYGISVTGGLKVRILSAEPIKELYNHIMDTKATDELSYLSLEDSILNSNQNLIQDKLILTASLSLIGVVVVIITAIPVLDTLVRFSLIISILSLSLCFLLLLWHEPRLKLKKKILSKIVEQRIAKVKKDIKDITKIYYRPLVISKYIIKLQNLKQEKIHSKKDLQKAITLISKDVEKDMEKFDESDSFTTKFIYQSFFSDIFYAKKEVFENPLEEKHSGIKYFLDIFADKFRIHFFVVGFISLTFALIIHLIIK